MDAPQSPALRNANSLAFLFALVLPTFATLAYFVWLADVAAGWKWVAYGGGKVVQFSLPAIWIVLIHRKRLRWCWPGTGGLGEGVAFGLLVFAVMLALYHVWLEPSGTMESAKGAVEARLARFGIDSRLGFFALGGFIAVIHSLLEEYYWRWFVFGGLQRLTSFRPAMVVSSLGFMAHHVILLGAYFGQWSALTLLFSLGVAVGGAVWAWIYRRSGSLLGPWISHLVVDFAIFVVGYHMIWGNVD